VRRPVLVGVYVCLVIAYEQVTNLLILDVCSKDCMVHVLCLNASWSCPRTPLSFTVSWLLYSLCYCSLFRVLEFCTLQKLVTSHCRSQFCYIIRWNLCLVTRVRSSYVGFFYLTNLLCCFLSTRHVLWSYTFFSHGAAAPSGPGLPHDHTQAYLRDNRQLSLETDFILPEGFEPVIPASEPPRIYSLDCAATGVGGVIR
jgi:hypothetical protein